MSRRTREPVAEIGAEDYRIVKHTHDIEAATELMLATMRAEQAQDWAPDPTPADKQYTSADAGRPKQTYIRIQGALPNSFAAAEGWSYAYHEYDKPGRGAFPAVVFR